MYAYNYQKIHLAAAATQLQVKLVILVIQPESWFTHEVLWHNTKTNELENSSAHKNIVHAALFAVHDNANPTMQCTVVCCNIVSSLWHLK